MSALPLATIKELKKQYGKKKLFENLSFIVPGKAKIGIVGPNGAGKSSLLKIIAGIDEADSGEIVLKKKLKISYVTQTASFNENISPLELALKAASENSFSESETLSLAHTALGQLDIKDLDAPSKKLSGGQQKRLQIALGLCSDPDLLLLDEPTNHLDIGSILLLENLLSRSSFSWIAISHDRTFLNSTVSSIAEINPRYKENIFLTEGNYSEYLRRKADYLSAEARQRGTLESKVRTEEAWLKQGAKARSTKSKGRTESAHQLIDTLGELKSRQQERKVNLVFTASKRKTKELAAFNKVSKSFADLRIFKELSLKVIGGKSIGVLGLNGSGKSTFVNLLSGELEPDSGTIKRATELKVSHFRQFEKDIENETLKSYLAGESDSVVFLDKVVHVASWASRFQFAFDQLEQPFKSLSGGEKSRARIARLMLETPDILILDEPTNDLDIETLEILESSLRDFTGALVLVTHDRTLINNLCDSFLGLDGKGDALFYADYKQWEKEIVRGKKSKESSSKKNTLNESEQPSATKPDKKKLTYKEQKEYNSIEKKIQKQELKVEELEKSLSEPDIQQDLKKLEEKCEEIAKVKKSIETHYSRWEELEGKMS